MDSGLSVDARAVVAVAEAQNAHADRHFLPHAVPLLGYVPDSAVYG